jgi:hypothetical protein
MILPCWSASDYHNQELAEWLETLICVDQTAVFVGEEICKECMDVLRPTGRKA